jgi:acetone carboxylase gamma subunit
LGVGHLDSALFVDAVIEFREYSCPQCATLFATEVALASDAPLLEFEHLSWPATAEVGS